MARIPLSDLPETGSRIVELDGQRILICRSAVGIRAMNEICPHQHLSLEGGRVRSNFIMCPHHGARFSLEDGKSLSPLTPNSLTLYETREVDDELEIDL
ncbi:Rieske (2Fe-2S) protein (plasmid) [Sphingobium sp. SJ10-10]|uniref:Rieske (2Fe-2S) protein n=1 Tax=Sphingobium sp. SJ10-10 TaxID=3114999 RepID=UPI002E172696|nr:Rieske (2Fe-2S) protein [Sphingobium sp. SJ10-10]